MIMWLLGLIDVLIGINFGLMAFGIYYFKILSLIFGIYLFGKGIVFISSIASFIDLAAGILLIVSYFLVLPNFLLIIAGLLVLQKGIFSFF